MARRTLRLKPFADKRTPASRKPPSDYVRPPLGNGVRGAGHRRHATMVVACSWGDVVVRPREAYPWAS